jgi:hypothetical protein
LFSLPLPTLLCFLLLRYIPPPPLCSWPSLLPFPSSICHTSTQRCGIVAVVSNLDFPARAPIMQLMGQPRHRVFKRRLTVLISAKHVHPRLHLSVAHFRAGTRTVVALGQWRPRCLMVLNMPLAHIPQLCVTSLPSRRRLRLHTCRQRHRPTYQPTY